MNNTSVAEEAIREMRRILAESITREEIWWSALSNRHRKGILRVADINAGFSLKEWDEIVPTIRCRIIGTALKVSKWTRKISAPLRRRKKRDV